MGDMRAAHGLLACLPSPNKLLADAAYGSTDLRASLPGRGTTPVSPNNPTRKRVHSFYRAAYRARNAIERTFSRLDWRRIHT